MSNPNIYTVGWICAVETELVAAASFLDEKHDDPEYLPVNDNNSYVLGRIGKHNVVIAALPNGQYGLVTAATVARDMFRSFSNIRIGLLVGNGGGAPSANHDIRLGDIVVSSPGPGSGGVFQYDYGKTIQNSEFVVTSHLNQPPQFILAAIATLKAHHERRGHDIEKVIADVLSNNRRLQRKYRKPDPSTDRLYTSAYVHAGTKEQECVATCDTKHLNERPGRSEEQDSPTIHYGTIASANQLMKDAKIRDTLSTEKDVLCFEMEAAGLMNQFPCVIIRGICDYSYTHKNKDWQGYAAMAAAAYAKDLLYKVAPNKIEAEKKLVDVLSGIDTKVAKIESAIQNQTQQHERRDQDDKDKQCLRDLLVTDPRIDKSASKKPKAAYSRFRNDQQNRLLWIKGDPGKGKTMLLCGIIDHVKNPPAQGRILSYFFCQATDERINNATAVLRSLFMLLDQDVSLMTYIRKTYDTTGKALFEDANAWQALSEIFVDILQDTKLQEVCLVVDALDECVKSLPQLLDLIVRTSRFPHTKWLVSSRNWVEIEEKLFDVAHRLSLELNAKSVSTAVETYINFKVSGLTQLKGYQENIAEEVRRYLLSNANDTFLWVALLFPPGLNALYQRMVEYIADSRDAQACREILALASTVHRPISMDELRGLTQAVKDLGQEEVQEVIASCGSFLTLRDNIVFFVHQSAKDFLLEKATDQTLSFDIENQHFKIFAVSLDLFATTLRRDIYDLCNPGYPIDKVEIPSPDPLASIRYSCVYWVDHLQDAGVIKRTVTYEKSVVTDTLRFLNINYLHWLEALSLIHCIPEGIKAIQKLERVLADNDSEQLQNLATDARRFLLSQKGGIELAPLQTYTSALMFSPTNSLIKRTFRTEFPIWIGSAPKVELDWNACLQTLEGHSNSVNFVAISPDGRRLARSRGYRLVIYMPNTQSQGKIDLLRLLGAEVYPVPAVAFDNPENYNHQAARHAERLVREQGEGASVWTNQFDNTANRRAHIETTGPEIWAQTGGKVDAFTCATGTGGTLAGTTRYLKDISGGRVKSFLADPPGSVLHSYIQSGGKLAERQGGSITEGIGQAGDEKTIEMVYRCLDEEGLYLGASSALNVVAAKEVAEKMGPGHTVVTALCDGAYRYADRLFSRQWLESKNLIGSIPESLKRYIVLP
ncbi:hypothetical protein G7054_g13313 [Neopestalotiopsis clavispora]|nr:hypothetical protein G7054_g13313 [Neopestalotiopsis clavispora]